MAIRAAPRRGARARRPRARSVRGRSECNWPARNKDRNPRPAKAKLLCPLGKLLHPSCSVCESVSVQTRHVTSVSAGVPFSGLHLAIRSGRGRPTAFLITSVIKEVRNSDMKRPRIVTFVLWPSRLVRRMNRRMQTSGTPMLYANSQTVTCKSPNSQLFAKIHTNWNSLYECMRVLDGHIVQGKHAMKRGHEELYLQDISTGNGSRRVVVYLTRR